MLLLPLPPLGVCLSLTRFNGHPPLGVNATKAVFSAISITCFVFQRAPTLGGECYLLAQLQQELDIDTVSTGTHPWG